VKDPKRLLGVCMALGAIGFALSARADVFNPNIPVDSIHSVGAANTAGSFAASAMMGAKGHSNQSLLNDWENSITSLCATQSRVTNPGTRWPGACTPAGMAAALANLTARSWVQFTWASTDQASALNDIISSLRDHGSPAIVPIYGQADHWVAVIQVTATAGAGTWTIGNVKIYDGGPVDGLDGSGNSYQSGLVSYSPNIWKMNYYLVVGNINPTCDPCTTDPWYQRYVLMWEPPLDRIHSAVAANFPRSPGVASDAVTTKLARSLVWKSLTAAGIDADPDIWNPISGGIAGVAFEVNGVSPAGDRWDYFLVPILSTSGAANTVKAIVQLAADDASFESVHVLSSPGQFIPLDKPVAELLARTALNPGESLSAGVLTWDPRAKTPFAKAPTFPYYEFAILDGLKEVGVVRVSFNKGAVSRTP
jgi:hypothetical protein